MDKAFSLFRYLYYLINAKDEHSLHSPFVYTLYTEVISPPNQYYIFQKIEALRESLKASGRTICVKDFGAGSKSLTGKIRKVSDIAARSEKPARQAQALFRLVNYFKPQTILELGTSLGLTTLYLASPSSKNKVISFEGCPETLSIAQENFAKFGIKNIETVEGNLDETLPQKLKQLNKVDFVFFDANHRYAPTISYFHQCLKKAHEDSVFVFDDIHWSKEMEMAWNEIKAHPEVMITIDLFFLGLVFFRKKQPKQHFVLKF